MRRPTPLRRSRSCLWKAGASTVPTPRSSPTRRRIRQRGRRRPRSISASSSTSPSSSALSDDARWMMEAVALGQAARGTTAPNPNVGCIIVRGQEIVGRGATGRGGRPHAEALALAEAGDKARKATLYVTLEPCAHPSERGPTCSDSIVRAGIGRVVAGVVDPDTRTAGRGLDRLHEAGIPAVGGVAEEECARSLEGYLTRMRLGRPYITLKL